MNTSKDIREAFAAFRKDNHTVPDETLGWCREAALACAGISDPLKAIPHFKAVLEHAKLTAMTREQKGMYEFALSYFGKEQP